MFEREIMHKNLVSTFTFHNRLIVKESQIRKKIILLDFY